MNKELKMIIILVGVIIVAFWSHYYIIKKHEEVRISRASIHTPPHTVGSNCLMGGESIAILKKYLDKDDLWVYDVMVLDDEKETTARLGVTHKSIKYCEE